MNNRFIPKKRRALDNKIWWCVWDNERNDWSSYICHGKYKTKKDCAWCINKYNMEFKEVNKMIGYEYKCGLTDDMLEYFEEHYNNHPCSEYGMCEDCPYSELIIIKEKE